MNTTAQTKVAANLLEFAQLLKDEGFTVLRPESDEYFTKWFFFFKDGKFGTVSNNGFRGFTFSTVHKPCRECGTGYRIGEDFEDLTVKNALACFVTAPNWANRNDIKAIRKYKDVAEFLEKNKWANYQIF